MVLENPQLNFDCTLYIPYMDGIHFGTGTMYSVLKCSLVPRPRFPCSFFAVRFSTAAKKAAREGLGMRLLKCGAEKSCGV